MQGRLLRYSPSCGFLREWLGFEAQYAGERTTDLKPMHGLINALVKAKRTGDFENATREAYGEEPILHVPQAMWHYMNATEWVQLFGTGTNMAEAWTRSALLRRRRKCPRYNISKIGHQIPLPGPKTRPTAHHLRDFYFSIAEADQGHRNPVLYERSPRGMRKLAEERQRLDCYSWDSIDERLLAVPQELVGRLFTLFRTPPEGFAYPGEPENYWDAEREPRLGMLDFAATPEGYVGKLSHLWRGFPREVLDRFVPEDSATKMYRKKVKTAKDRLQEPRSQHSQKSLF